MNQILLHLILSYCLSISIFTWLDEFQTNKSIECDRADFTVDCFRIASGSFSSFDYVLPYKLPASTLSTEKYCERMKQDKGINTNGKYGEVLLEKDRESQTSLLVFEFGTPSQSLTSWLQLKVCTLLSHFL